MIITAREYKEMGFEPADIDETLLISYVKRAEHILNALCRERLAAAAKNESTAALVKQAVAFETEHLIKTSNSGSMSCVSLGDVSYTESSVKQEDDVPQTVKTLLCSAGCLFAGTEVSE